MVDFKLRLSSTSFLISAFASIIILGLLFGIGLKSVRSDSFVPSSTTLLNDTQGKDGVQRSLACEESVKEKFPLSILESVSIELHRNGDADACGSLQTDLSIFESALNVMNVCLDSYDKFQFEAWLSLVLNNVHSCGPTDMKKPIASGFLGFCDRGPDKTPILTDHHRLVSLPSSNTLPCHFHTREGVRISGVDHLLELMTLAKTSPTCLPGDENCRVNGPSLHIYAVPAGRVFMFAPKFIGEIFELPHVTGDGGSPISLKVLSTEPRVFDIFNFFSRDESAHLVNKAIKETSESHRIKRSTTGAASKSVFAKRTSESGFDTHGKVAVEVKKRCFKILGFDEYIEGHGDGLQILRYNLTTAYTQHMDWIDDPSGKLPHNYDSAGVGGNRFSTILMYMSDLDENAGGETVFTEAWPVDIREEDRVDLKSAIRSLRESGATDGILERGSWEEEMVAYCRTRLAIRPSSGRAVLFYSQLPNGEPDPASKHGGCPVLKGEKYASNLWVWNTIRDGYEGAPRNPNARQSAPTTAENEKKIATFTNNGLNPMFDDAELFYGEEMFWSKLGKGHPAVAVNTFPGHVWILKVNGEAVKKWQITADQAKFNFEI